MGRDLPSGTVTFLFTDVEGSTKLLHDLGAEAYAEALAEHRRILREAFARHGGTEVDTQGDAFFVAFSDATDAVAAAQEACNGLADRPIRARMGVHTGVPHLTDEGYIGRDVHKGARIAAAGHGGQVLLSNETRDLVQAEVSDLGEHRLKDFETAVPIYQLGSDRFPPLKTISNTNLPRPVSSFVGREREVEEIGSLITDGARLVTLTGPGGTGKTRLALEIAVELVGEFKAGIFWIGLAPLRDSALVIDTIAQTLGAKEGLAEHIGEREMLLLLDNLEQVVESAPELASLAESCPNLRLLTTSRERLRVRGEVEYPVPPLDDPEAVELFCDRAPVERDAAIHELCRALDNLPLAIELAAARVSVLSPHQILDRLAKRLDLLKGGRDADPRQQTLRATIEWSHELLTHEEQRLFARLSVFRGGWALETAEQVAGADVDTLQSLVDKSLVRHRDDRFGMLETIREYAAERLAESDNPELVRTRHRDWYLGLVERAGHHLFGGPHQADWLSRLDDEIDNVRAALEWSQLDPGAHDASLRLAVGMWRFWEIRGYLTEGRKWLEAALAETRRAASELRANGLTGAGILAFMQGDHAAALGFHEESLEEHRRLGNATSVAYALSNLANVAVDLEDYERARACFEEAASLHRSLGRGAEEAGASLHLAEILDRQGDAARAKSVFEAALTTLAELPDRSANPGERQFVNFLLGTGLSMYAAATLKHGDLQLARQLALRALSEYRELGAGREGARILALLADIADAQGDASAAISLLLEALAMRHDTGDRPGVAGTLERLAMVVAPIDAERAGRLLGAAEGLRDQMGTPVPTRQWARHDELRSALQATLGARRFEIMRETGRLRTLAETVADASAMIGHQATRPL